MIRIIIVCLIGIFTTLLLVFMKGASVSNETVKKIEDEKQIRWLKEYKHQKRK